MNVEAILLMWEDLKFKLTACLTDILHTEDTEGKTTVFANEDIRKKYETD